MVEKLLALLGRRDTGDVLVRPPGLAYWLDEKPPLGTTALLGLQHAALSLSLLVYAVLAAREAGLQGADAQNLVTWAIVGVGIATILEATNTRFGSGFLLVHVPNPMLLATYAIAVKGHGLAAANTGLIVMGLCQIVLAPQLPKLKSWFPAEVCGVVVAVLGLAMMDGAARRFAGIDEAQIINPDATIVGAVTLGTIIVLSVWARGVVKLVAVVIGALAGYAGAYWLGVLNPTTMSSALTQPVFQVPSLTFVGLSFSPQVIGLMLLTGAIGSLDSIGCITTADKMNNADWRRADLGRVSGGISAEGCSNILAGLVSGYSTGISSANIGLAFATGTTARIVGTTAGAILVASAFLPEVSALLALMPEPVVGAIQIYAACFLVTSGMELILSRVLDERRIFMVGLSITIGIVALVTSALEQAAPPWAEEIVSDSFLLASISAIVFNALFRVGAKRRAKRAIDRDTTPEDLSAFIFDASGKLGARRRAVEKAATALVRLVDELVARHRLDQPGEVRVAWTDDEIEIRVTHDGPPMALLDQAPDWESALTKQTSDLAPLFAALPTFLLRHFVDEIKVRPADTGRATVIMTLET